MASVVPELPQNGSFMKWRRVATTLVVRAVPAAGLAFLSILVVVKMAFPKVVTHATISAVAQTRILI